MSAATQPDRKVFEVVLVIFPGMTNLDFAGPLEVLARMPGARASIVSKDGMPIRTDLGFGVAPTHGFANAPQADLLFIGGGPGINQVMQDTDTLEFLSRQSGTAQWVTSVCTGALALGAAGLLRGYRAATHWTAMEALRPFGAEPIEERVVTDRNRVTGGGVTAGIDFGLVIAKLLHGEQVAEGVQLGMEYDPQPPTRSGSPRTAPAALVAKLRAAAGPMTAERVALANAIAKRNGWIADA